MSIYRDESTKHLRVRAIEAALSTVDKCIKYEGEVTFEILMRNQRVMMLMLSVLLEDMK
jgi:hypothetical protein